MIYPRFFQYSNMTLKKVKPSLNRIAKSLAETQDAREFLLKNTREIIIISSRSIISAHKGDMKSAKNYLKQADILLKKYKKKITSDLQKYMITPEQEYVEVASLIAIMEKRKSLQKKN